MSKNYKKSIFFFIFAVTAAALWYFQSLIVVNVPFWDDFHGIIRPVYDLLSDIPLQDKLTALFSQNNEHRITNDRLFMWAVYLIRGNFDMRLLALIGFVNLIGIIWVFVRVFQKENISLLYLIPAVFFLFQAQYYESLQSLMVPFQNFSVIFYAFLAFYLVIYGKGSTYLFGFFFAALSFYTHGNGVFVIVIGAMILFVTGPRKRFFIWSFLAVLIILSYFYGYKKPDWSTSSSPLERPVESFFYFFEFLGSFSLTYVEMSTSLINSFLKKGFPTLIGFVVFGGFVYLFFKNYPLKFNIKYLAGQLKKLSESRFEMFVLAGIIFFLFTGVILALHRTGFPMMSRYTINSALFVSLVYIYIYYHSSARFKSIWFKVFTVAGLSYLVIGYYNNWDIASYKRKLAITDGLNWKRNHIWANQYFDSKHTQNLNNLLDEAYNAKMYTFPVTILDQIDNIPFESKSAPLEMQQNGYLINFTDHEDKKMSLDTEDGIYYVFKSRTYEFIVPGFRMKNGFLKFLSSGRYNAGITKTGFSGHLFPDDQYEIIKVENDKGVLHKYRTGKIIENTNYGADYKN